MLRCGACNPCTGGVSRASLSRFTGWLGRPLQAKLRCHQGLHKRTLSSVATSPTALAALQPSDLSPCTWSLSTWRRILAGAASTTRLQDAAELGAAVKRPSRSVLARSIGGDDQTSSNDDDLAQAADMLDMPLAVASAVDLELQQEVLESDDPVSQAALADAYNLVMESHDSLASPEVLHVPTDIATSSSQDNGSTSSPPSSPSSLLDPSALSPLQAWQEGKLSFGFSAGGLLFPYYIGCCLALRDLDLLRADTQVAGASAGSLIAACTKSGLSLEDILTACLELTLDCRANGTRFRLRGVLERSLKSMLPEDIAERCRGTVHVAVTQLRPRFQAQLISQFRSREDLVQALLTSCHIPWYLNGSAYTKFREGIYVDGGLTNFLPAPPGTTCVRVCCLPSRQLRGSFGMIAISPDLYGDAWPHNLAEMLGWALQAAPEETLLKLVDKGRADATAWAVKEGFPTALKQPAEAKRPTEEKMEEPIAAGVRKS